MSLGITIYMLLHTKNQWLCSNIAFTAHDSLLPDNLSVLHIFYAILPSLSSDDIYLSTFLSILLITFQLRGIKPIFFRDALIHRSSICDNFSPLLRACESSCFCCRSEEAPVCPKTCLILPCALLRLKRHGVLTYIIFLT